MAKATAAFKTTDFVLPKQVVAEMSRKIADQSVIATLSAAQPKIFADSEYLVFTQEPEAEYVQEGAAKSPSKVAFAPITGGRHKLQVTVRVNEEVRFADEDNQLDILDRITSAFGGAIGRAIDYNMLHGVDTLTGADIPGLASTKLDATAEKFEIEGDFPTIEELDSFPDSVINEGYVPNGIALAPTVSNALRKMRNEYTGAKIFPDVRMDLQVGNFEGLASVTSNNVNGKLATTPPGTLAYVGDFGLIRWGFVRNIGIEEILYGDPDGLGDLKRYNQIAYRAEAIYSFANFDPKGFAYMAKKA